MELSENGRAMKYFELAPFEPRLTIEPILAAPREDEDGPAGKPGPTT